MEPADAIPFSMRGVARRRPQVVFPFVLSFCLFAGSGVSAAPAAVPDSAYAELVAAAPEQRLLAVVRCTRSERVSPESRSERAVLHTIVVIAPPGSVATGRAVVLTRYAQGPDPLLPGTM